MTPPAPEPVTPSGEPVAEVGEPPPGPRAAPALRTPLLFLNVIVVATCGLVYELLAGTLASHVLGDSVTQFSLVIGIYLSAMGVGSWLSGFLDRRLAVRFVDVELGVALLGGLSAPILLLAFARLSWFPVVLYGLVFIIGVLVGLEIPLLMRICKDLLDFKDLVARILTLDYAGALLASLLFPLVFVPHLGLIRTSLFFGLCNAGVALWGTSLLRPLLEGQVRLLRVRGALVVLLLGGAWTQADALTGLAEDDLFADPVILSKTTPYQRIVVTRGHQGFALFLNGNLQFHQADEYRYHEALVHPVLAAADRPPERVLVLGGGDGLAVREVLRWPSVREVTLVELDPAMATLATEFQPLVDLNRGALKDPRVRVIEADAYVWLDDRLKAGRGRGKGDTGPPGFDAALVDFPDPNNYALGKLYTRRFYQLLRAALAPGAAVGVQATSPLAARRSFWCVVETMRQSGLHVRPYHATVPSFGVWGYVLARAEAFDAPRRAPPGLRFLTDEILAGLFVFPPDLDRPTDRPVEINRLDNQALVRLYEAEWSHAP